MLAYRGVACGFGLGPAGFHVLSIALALACTLASLAVFWLLTRSVAIAFAAAALFAVHPVHTEAVDWIAALPELGCSLSFLLAFALFLSNHNRKDDDSSSSSNSLRWLVPAVSLLAFALALLWKETAAVFPLLIMAYLLVVGVGSRIRSALQASGPYWAVLAAYLILRRLVLGSLASGQREWGLSRVQLCLTAVHLMFSYWKKLALPFKLNAYYAFSPVRSLSDQRAIAGIVLAVCAVGALILLKRRSPLGVFAALWVFLTLVPPMDINALGRNVFTERYLYLPSTGFCLLVTLVGAALVRQVPAKFRVVAGSLLLVTAVSSFVYATVERNPVWKDDATLFSETLRASPDAPFVRNMVAATQNEDPRESGAAEENYLQAIRLAKEQQPQDRLDLVTAYEGLAGVYADRTDYPRALAMLQQVSQIAPESTEADDERGLILARAGRWSEAEAVLSKTMAARPEDENALSAAGLLEWQYHHNLNKAVELLSRALAIHSQSDTFSASVHNNLGAVYGELGQFPSAVTQFKSAVDTTPGDPEYHTNLASALAASGRYEDARLEAEAALNIAPDYAEARAILQQLSSSNGR